MTSDKRRRDLAAIHASKKQLGMEDDTYRQMLMQVTGKNSAKDLTAGERISVLRRMKTLGAGKGQQQKSVYPGTPHNIDSEPMLQKVEAQLADMGLAWAYADAIAKRMFRIDKVAWLKTTDQLKAVISALHSEQKKRDREAEL